MPTYAFWALTRLGARVLLLRPAQPRRAPAGRARRGSTQLLTFKPGNDSEPNGWAFCLAQLARRTGQRALDVDDAIRQRVLDVLHGLKVPAHWSEMVERVVHLEAGDRGQLFGESLPIGLRLVD